MKIPKPNIQSNNGKPVALCNRCFCVMCYVKCNNNDLEKENNCVIVAKRPVGDKFYITAPLGSVPPSYCDICSDLLFKYSLN